MGLGRIDRDALIAPYDVIGHPPAPDLSALAELAAEIAVAPTAVINLMGETTQHSVAGYGRDPGVCDRADSMCNVVLDEPGQVVVEDTRSDPRFADNPFVTGERAAFRFYAATHLRNPQGLVLGTLCVFDEETRSLDHRRIRGLGLLARQVDDALELRRRTSKLVDAVAELAEVRAELARSNEALHAFAGQVSHDLRNPLTAINGFLEELQYEVPHDTPSSEYVARALTSTHRMSELITDLLGFSKLGGQLRREPVALRNLVEEVRHDLAPALSAVGARMDVGPLPTVRVDPAQLRAVLQNLISNAAKYRHPERSPLIALHSCRQDHAWRIEVVDNGIGVPRDRREEAFSPLARVHDPHDSSAEGAGIGLATARRIITAHGGQIGLEASPTGGTVAWFTLPDPLEGGSHGAGHRPRSARVS
ncbi:sensor histidine kinase [Cryptosporangium minutisporangium]|uniref:Sensor-like histidine kinase SenX3 n=1 Tax=Cryptosporangium minutisporangium TaxID=113569 RepID=A0ABP6SYN3_9ACTN